MRAVSVAPISAAICCDGKSAVEENSSVKFDGDDSSWFAEAVQGLLPKPLKQGYELSLLADWDERLCQKYAADNVKPSAYFLRRILRSPHGWQWLNATMDGSNAEWWIDLQRTLRVGRAALAESNKR